MKKWVCLLLVALILSACSEKGEKETEVLIETSMGDIRVKLFNDTPLHRDNFIRLARGGFYDEMMFHRIIPELMIQTGDPKLKPAGKAVTVDTASLGYTVPQEILFPKYIHRPGMLAAAREPDSINAPKASSSSQFYIVTGEKYTASSLGEFYQTLYQEAVANQQSQLKKKCADRLMFLRESDEDAFDALMDSIVMAGESWVANHPPRPFNEQQKRIYTTEGGCPHLDGEYTIFGQVIEGMPVVQKIAHVATSETGQPLREVYVKKVTVLE